MGNCCSSRHVITSEELNHSRKVHNANSQSFRKDVPEDRIATSNGKEGKPTPSGVSNDCNCRTKESKRRNFTNGSFNSKQTDSPHISALPNRTQSQVGKEYKSASGVTSPKELSFNSPYSSNSSPRDVFKPPLSPSPRDSPKPPLSSSPRDSPKPLISTSPRDSPKPPLSSSPRENFKPPLSRSPRDHPKPTLTLSPVPRDPKSLLSPRDLSKPPLSPSTRDSGKPPLGLSPKDSNRPPNSSGNFKDGSHIAPNSVMDVKPPSHSSPLLSQNEMVLRTSLGLLSKDGRFVNNIRRLSPNDKEDKLSRVMKEMVDDPDVEDYEEIDFFNSMECLGDEEVERMVGNAVLMLNRGNNHASPNKEGGSSAKILGRIREEEEVDEENRSKHNRPDTGAKSAVEVERAVRARTDKEIKKAHLLGTNEKMEMEWADFKDERIKSKEKEEKDRKKFLKHHLELTTRLFPFSFKRSKDEGKDSLLPSSPSSSPYGSHDSVRKSNSSIVHERPKFFFFPSLRSPRASRRSSSWGGGSDIEQKPKSKSMKDFFTNYKSPQKSTPRSATKSRSISWGGKTDFDFNAKNLNLYGQDDLSRDDDEKRRLSSSRLSTSSSSPSLDLMEKTEVNRSPAPNDNKSGESNHLVSGSVESQPISKSRQPLSAPYSVPSKLRVRSGSWGGDIDTRGWPLYLNRNVILSEKQTIFYDIDPNILTPAPLDDDDEEDEEDVEVDSNEDHRHAIGMSSNQASLEPEVPKEKRDMKDVESERDAASSETIDRSIRMEGESKKLESHTCETKDVKESDASGNDGSVVSVVPLDPGVRKEEKKGRAGNKPKLSIDVQSLKRFEFNGTDMNKSNVNLNSSSQRQNTPESPLMEKPKTVSRKPTKEDGFDSFLIPMEDFHSLPPISPIQRRARGRSWGGEKDIAETSENQLKSNHISPPAYIPVFIPSRPVIQRRPRGNSWGGEKDIRYQLKNQSSNKSSDNSTSSHVSSTSSPSSSSISPSSQHSSSSYSPSSRPVKPRRIRGKSWGGEREGISFSPSSLAPNSPSQSNNPKALHIKRKSWGGGSDEKLNMIFYEFMSSATSPLPSPRPNPSDSVFSSTHRSEQANHSNLSGQNTPNSNSKQSVPNSPNSHSPSVQKRPGVEDKKSNQITQVYTRESAPSVSNPTAESSPVFVKSPNTAFVSKPVSLKDRRHKSWGGSGDLDLPDLIVPSRSRRIKSIFSDNRVQHNEDAEEIENDAQKSSYALILDSLLDNITNGKMSHSLMDSSSLTSNILYKTSLLAEKSSMDKAKIHRKSSSWGK